MQDSAYNFLPRNGRVKQQTAIKPAFVVLLYGVGKASYGLSSNYLEERRSKVATVRITPCLSQ